MMIGPVIVLIEGRDFDYRAYRRDMIATSGSRGRNPRCFHHRVVFGGLSCRNAPRVYAVHRRLGAVGHAGLCSSVYHGKGAFVRSARRRGRIKSLGVQKVKILVLGGDGFCGWPTSLQLSRSGHEVIIVDNLKRPEIDVELGVSSPDSIPAPR